MWADKTDRRPYDRTGDAADDAERPDTSTVS